MLIFLLILSKRFNFYAKIIFTINSVMIKMEMSKFHETEGEILEE